MHRGSVVIVRTGNRFLCPLQRNTEVLWILLVLNIDKGHLEYQPSGVRCCSHHRFDRPWNRPKMKWVSMERSPHRTPRVRHRFVHGLWRSYLTTRRYDFHRSGSQWQVALVVFPNDSWLLHPQRLGSLALGPASTQCGLSQSICERKSARHVQVVVFGHQVAQGLVFVSWNVLYICLINPEDRFGILVQEGDDLFTSEHQLPSWIV